MSDPHLQSSGSESGPDSIKSLAREVPRLGEHAASYLQAQVQRVATAVKLDLLQTVFWIFVVVLFLQATYLSLSLVLSGGSEGLGRVLGDRPWLGSIIVGGAFLLLVFLGIKLLLISLRRNLRKAKGAPEREREKIERSLAEIQRDLAGAFELRAWVRRFPLPATGAVAVLGFWAGGKMVHSDAESAPEAVPPSPELHPLWASLMEIAASTLSDIAKDAAHVWLQTSSESAAQESSPAAQEKTS